MEGLNAGERWLFRTEVRRWPLCFKGLPDGKQTSWPNERPCCLVSREFTLAISGTSARDKPCCLTAKGMIYSSKLSSSCDYCRGPGLDQARSVRVLFATQSSGWASDAKANNPSGCGPMKQREKTSPCCIPAVTHLGRGRSPYHTVGHLATPWT